MVKAFADFYGQCSNNVAEAKALLQCIQMCCNIGLLNVVVESDSLLIINMINRKMKTLWRIRLIIEHVWELTKAGNFQFVHTFREGNTTADQLENIGESTKTQCFSLKLFLCLDKLELL